MAPDDRQDNRLLQNNYESNEKESRGTTTVGAAISRPITGYLNHTKRQLIQLVSDGRLIAAPTETQGLPRYESLH